MLGLRTWMRYLASKIDYSVHLNFKRYENGQISGDQVKRQLLKNVLQGKLTFYHWNKGDEMTPTIAGEGGTILVRKFPYADKMRVFVGDVVMLKDPKNGTGYLVRRLAAQEGEEMVSTDEKESFILEGAECWVLSDNEKLKAKEAYDSRTFGPILRADIVGRVIYSLRTDVDHGPVQNSNRGMRMDSAVLEVELDVEEMANAKSSPA